MYRYTTFSAGTNIWCKAEDTKEQTKMIQNKLRIASTILEQEKKKKLLFKAKTKKIDPIRQRYVPNKNATGRISRKNFTLFDVINKPHHMLANSGQNGYAFQPKQSPGQFIAGQVGKFSDIISDPKHKHLSPKQIELWNLCPQIIVENINNIVLQRVWFEKDGFDNIMDKVRAEMHWFQKLLDDMPIQSEDIGLKQQQQKNQTLIDTGLIHSIQ